MHYHFPKRSDGSTIFLKKQRAGNEPATTAERPKGDQPIMYGEYTLVTINERANNERARLPGINDPVDPVDRYRFGDRAVLWIDGNGRQYWHIQIDGDRLVSICRLKYGDGRIVYVGHLFTSNEPAGDYDDPRYREWITNGDHIAADVKRGSAGCIREWINDHEPGTFPADPDPCEDYFLLSRFPADRRHGDRIGSRDRLFGDRFRCWQTIDGRIYWDRYLQPDRLIVIRERQPGSLFDLYIVDPVRSVVSATLIGHVSGTAADLNEPIRLLAAGSSRDQLFGSTFSYHTNGSSRETWERQTAAGNVITITADPVHIQPGIFSFTITGSRGSVYLGTYGQIVILLADVYGIDLPDGDLFARFRG